MKKTQKNSTKGPNAKNHVVKNQQDSKTSTKSTEKETKKAQLKSTKSQKIKKESDLDDTLLDVDVAETEEIPDLAEFDEKEDTSEEVNEVQEDEDSLDGSSDEMLAEKNEDEEVYLTDAEGRRLCRIRDCDQAAIVETYCRFHYLQNWKRIQVRRKILADGKLDFYVDELTSRYPDKFLEMIRKDLKTEKDFVAAIAELEIDESNLENDNEDESQEFIDEVRGVTESGISEDDDY